MLKSRVITGALVTGAFVIASLFAAAPASAATLPPGQKISVVDYNNWNFYYTDPATAALTPVGIGDPNSDEYVTAVDVDNDGLGFAFATTYESIPGVPDPENPNDPVFPTYEPVGAALFKADANTGQLLDGMKMSIDYGGDDIPAEDCTAIDYTAGVVIGICYNYSGGSVYIGTVDTDNAVLNATTQFGGPGFLFLTSIAVDPTTGIIWAFEDFFGSGYAYTVTLDGSYPDYEGKITDLVPLGADFDSSGQLWITAYEPGAVGLVIGPGDTGLATLDLTTLTSPFSETWPDSEFYSEAITVWGAALPATGPAESAGIAAGAAGFLLLGAILAVGATARRRWTQV